jgi:hypothetical protein
MRRAATLLVLQIACGGTVAISDGGPTDADAAVPVCTFDTPCVEGARCFQNPVCFPCWCGYDNQGVAGTPSPAIFVCQSGEWYLPYVVIDCWGPGRFADRHCNTPNHTTCPSTLDSGAGEASDGAVDAVDEAWKDAG